MKRLFFGLIVVAMALVAFAANASVKREGTWPADDKNISLDLDGVPRGQALRKLADAAGWSLVLQSSLGADADADAGRLIDVHVKDQPASKVLDLVMEDGWVATRDGTLVSMKYESPPSPQSIPAAPSSVALPSSVRDKQAERGKDRTLTGGNLTIAKDETVHDVTLFGGNLDVYGVVTGDVSLTGGNCTIHPGARVNGDVTGVGGNVTLEDGAEIMGDVSVVGGRLDKAAGARIVGDVTRSISTDEPERVGGKEKLRRGLRLTGNALTRSAFLFLFGAILLALGTRRMEALRGEIAARPMRTLALGVVGVIAGLAIFVALCITILGIPVALVALLLAIFAGYAGVVAVLTTVGEALLRHKTQSSYVHLAVGCALFLAAGWVPWVGTFVTLAVVLMGIGVVVATRGAGFVPKRTRGAGPYRTPG